MNSGISYIILGKKIVINVNERICETEEELLRSDLFREILTRCIKNLQKKNSLLLGNFDKNSTVDENVQLIMDTAEYLCKMPLSLIPNIVKGADKFLKDIDLFNDLVEYIYNFWRHYERYIICSSEGNALDKRPYRTFNETVEQLTHLVRKSYRDVQENITGNHPRIYRQIHAGAEVATIALPKDIPLPQGKQYEQLKEVPVIRQILIYPPQVYDPPMNKRTGRFERIGVNPLNSISVNKEEWLGYPAKVGPLFMMIYFHACFFELGFSLANLFELAGDEDLNKKPDAVYMFGVPGNGLDDLASFPTVFHEDTQNDMLVAAAPGRDEFGYFGYLKKMILTLHNIKMMKLGQMPFHGALLRIVLKGNRERNVLIIGDTGAGKSETLEAFRVLGEDMIQDIIIIADDMGSLIIDENGTVNGYGTEIGAFLRLDDLQPGYALGQIDRAIIMNASKVNARIILPVTSFQNLIKGHEVHYVLYANNYEQIDEDHPIIEQINNYEEAIKIFREGTVMSKGTTTSSGLVHSYFANVFGPTQYKELHELIAQKYFRQFFDKGIYVGQVRTRLGIPGWERKGPEEAAQELLNIFNRE